jgi:AcrR family transcriptional regulator
VNASSERIIRAAAVLFARRGFHGVTTREIAAASGLNIATVHYHVGSKQDLYNKVRELFHTEEQELITGIFEYATEHAVTRAADLPAFLSGIVDRLLDFWNRDPVRIRFRLRYWLDTEVGSAAPEAETDLNLYKRIDEALHAAQQAGIVRLDVDSGLFLRGFYMLVYGYFLSGAFDWQTLRGDPHDPAHLEAFKGLLLAYLCKMMNLNSE